MALPQPVVRAAQHLAASDRFARVAPRIVPRLDRALARVSGGRWLLAEAAIPSIVLATTGARSGEPRWSTVAAVPHDGDWYIVGSNFGGENHPAWSYNLLAHPEATMTRRGVQTPVTAILLGPEDKAVVWPELIAAWPPFDRYAQRSGRDLRVFRLRVLSGPV